MSNVGVTGDELSGISAVEGLQAFIFCHYIVILRVTNFNNTFPEFAINASFKAASLAIVLSLTVGCGAGGGSSATNNSQLQTASVDTSGQIFQADKLLQVDIEMDPADYDVLRQQGRQISDLASGCSAGFEYTNFEATVRIDGELVERVDIRKKGFLGSLSASRPSFKLNFDELVPGRSFHNLTRLTLNNNNQDRGNTHQCISYDMFRRAGLPAPRCNFARVSINGKDLGIYSNVESMEKPFLRRHFSDDEGNLYEAQVGGDFGPFNKDKFQLKTNQEINDRSDLDLVVAALAADDGDLGNRLGQAIDLDEYLSYWAMEGITGHWDSATGNANNSFVYYHPGDRKFHYLPWGTDGAMELENQLAPGTGPLYRYNAISARLYQIPEWREKYHQRVLDLLDQVWDPLGMSAEVDRIRDLTATDESELLGVRNFIALHEQRVRDSVAGTLVQAERTIVDQPVNCRVIEPSHISGQFSNGLASFEYIDREGQLVTVNGTISAPSEDSPIPLGDSITMSIAGPSAQGIRLAFLNMESGEFGALEIPFHGLSTTLFLIGSLNTGGFGIIGLSGAGSVRFDETPVLGQPASGSFSAELWLNDGSGNGLFGGF